MTVLIPGLVAVAPWLVWLVEHTPATLGADQSAVLANALIFALVVVAGSTCEGLGTYLEHRWDGKLESEHQVQEHWFRYLNYCGEREPVAFRYLSRLVTTLYFELAMLFATPTFVAGATLLAAVRFPNFRFWIASGGVLVGVAFVLYFRYQARQTHEGMCKVRKALNLPATNAG
ncbi:MULTISPECIES: hypothetical protein [unclassified Luteimonas]|uniref:hypothetical protein n=1 Tax=unclassified Luteimonas TaxID=2629088 RepID=UPI0018F08E1D|nr:hypothetical protein [Luteimonas sp. MC1895]MBJ6979925.1 hypothetical protein [Luteimonas sp. MC1895]